MKKEVFILSLALSTAVAVAQSAGGGAGGASAGGAAGAGGATGSGGAAIGSSGATAGSAAGASGIGTAPSSGSSSIGVAPSSGSSSIGIAPGTGSGLNTSPGGTIGTGSTVGQDSRGAGAIPATPATPAQPGSPGFGATPAIPATPANPVVPPATFPPSGSSSTITDPSGAAAGRTTGQGTIGTTTDSTTLNPAGRTTGEAAGRRTESGAGSVADRDLTQRVRSTLGIAGPGNSGLNATGSAVGTAASAGNLRNVQVTTSNGRVSLSGFVSSEEERARLEQQVRQISGVTQVENRLRIRGTSRDNTGLNTTSP